jgi:Asp/Glu/hydantoin racemase
MMPRIALIHAVTVAVDPIREALQRLWPEAEAVNLLDDALSVDRSKDEALSAALSARIIALADYAVTTEADGILFTCSAFGPAIEAAARRLPLPVLKPNEAMFDEALAAGERIGMLATFGPATATMEAEFAEAARGRKARLRVELVAEAMTALKQGDAETHNRLLAERAAQMVDCDVIMLAHFSTARAALAVRAALARPVLTSPDAAVLKLRARLTRGAAA